jgi:DNA invertase Pin-like site-specific DNA recombinase
MARLGYARVSTDDQTMDLQKDALRLAGCLDIYEETASGKRQERPALAHVLRACREGDVLVVWKLDRLGRSLRHLIEIVEELHQRGCGFQVLTGVPVDTSTPHGRFAFQLFGALAEYERELIRERVMAGLAAARARGRKGGRRPKLSPEQQQHAAMMAQGGIPITTIAQTLQCSRHTVYKALAHNRLIHAGLVPVHVPATDEAAD